MAESNAQGRKRRKTMVGLVTSDKMQQTRKVEITRLQKHPLYGKYLRRSQVCYVHDSLNESKAGDEVEIMECRPISKLKRWRLVRVLRSKAGKGSDAGPVADQPGTEQPTESAPTAQT